MYAPGKRHHQKISRLIMSNPLIIIASMGYLLLLFGVAYLAERQSSRGKSWVNNPYVYALSLGVYCTAWTFYGSVGRAATGGMSFIPIFLGPSILAPLWLIVMHKMATISKHQRITSIADFISSRYGKSTSLGMIATIIAVMGVIPYISIQLKAIGTSYNVLRGLPITTDIPFYRDPALLITIFLTLFTILFGTRRLDPNERHEGMVAAIAFESIFKLAAFLAIGLFAIFALYRGIGPLFAEAATQPNILQLFQFDSTGMTGWQWFWLLILSMLAITLLPRQFHVSVVENTNLDHLRRATWLFPLYLLLINLFVLPIAIAGLLQFNGLGIDPDTFVLNLPLKSGQPVLALLVALGGFSAASSMVIVSTIALSIMLSNQVVLPVLFKPSLLRLNQQNNLQRTLINIRRISIFVILLLAYGYFRLVASEYTLVSIGLISFAAIAQFAPALFGGLYWRQATRNGAIAGLTTGFITWCILLPLPTLLDPDIFQISPGEVAAWGDRRWHIEQLLTMNSNERIAHASFWSLLLNVSTFFTVSIYSRQRPLEVTQADLFVNIYKYQEQQQAYQVRRRQARVGEIHMLLQRFLGKLRSTQILKHYEGRFGKRLQENDTGEAELINLAETHLAGSIGASSAKIIIASITKEDPISLEEMLKILEQTQEAIAYSRALERKSKELERTSQQLREANKRLQELDSLKAEFISTVTHELRTPITSIKSLSRILLDNPNIEQAQKREFLQILVIESERITRLINQVLDVEKIGADPQEEAFTPVDLRTITNQAFIGLQQLIREHHIVAKIQLPEHPLRVLGQSDRLTQVIVNLLSNAIKFCPESNGQLTVTLSQDASQAHLAVSDNGRGIPRDKQQFIFDKFTQVNNQESGKPAGSGLGLYISRKIVENHKGSIRVESKLGQGATFIVSLPKFLVPVDAFSWDS